MSAPIEFRLYASKFTLDDLKQGKQFVFDEKREPYNVAMLQYR